jgi:uncharacterized membrane protein
MLAWFVRFVHISCAIGAIGAPFFVRFALMPAASSTLDEAADQNLRESINKRWRHIVYLLITLFILTGSFNFFVETRNAAGDLITARWKAFSPEDKRLYHMIFGIKVLAAFVIFFLASALAGRTATFAPLRKNARVTVTLLLLLGLLVVICSTLLRFLPMHPMPPEPTMLP